MSGPVTGTLEWTVQSGYPRERPELLVPIPRLDSFDPSGGRLPKRASTTVRILLLALVSSDDDFIQAAQYLGLAEHGGHGQEIAA